MTQASLRSSSSSTAWLIAQKQYRVSLSQQSYPIDADSNLCADVADQFQQGGKLPWMTWILPNAKFNRDHLDTAWFTPHPLPTLAPTRPELLPDEDEEGMLESVAYLDSIVEACVAAGVPPNRIVLGGFSQGCAMSLLWYLTTSKYSGKLAGIVGLLGFLVLSDGKQRIQELRADAGLEAVPPKLPLFLARGTKDPLITNRVWNYTLSGLKDLGIEDHAMEVHTYPGLEHTIHGPLLRDMCAWLEKTLPEIG